MPSGNLFYIITYLIVNCKFAKVVQSAIGTDSKIHFLHCNAHVLLDLSSTYEKHTQLQLKFVGTE